MRKNFLQRLKKKKEELALLLVGLCLVFFFSTLLFINPEPIAGWVNSLENFGYDLQVRHFHKPLGKDPPVTIVNIDDKSFQAEGKWPWPRKTFAELLEKLYANGATVVAFDMIFSDPETNIADEILKTHPTFSDLKGIREEFDYDAIFAKSLGLGDSVLGIVFLDHGETRGVLPPPFLELTPAMAKDLAIPDKPEYLASLEALEKAAKSNGFINATPDPDGILRFSPLLFRHGNEVYASLAFQAASDFLLIKNKELVTQKYDKQDVLEGIKVDQLFIPTDPTGKILIPFRGSLFSFPFVSAIDVLNDTAEKSLIENKIIFIGSTAAGIGDHYPSAITSVFPGVEVHATIAAGIIDGYLPYKPAWGKGVTFFVMLVLGVIYACILPFFGILGICLLCCFLFAALIFLDQWLWIHYGLVISIVLPIFLVLLLFVLNLLLGYLFESKKGKELKSIFSQYVPPAYLDLMLKEGGEFNLEGESKELSVLFADIFNFTGIAEKLSPTELKQFLNRYFTRITEVIFTHQGIIDKYVGDCVMAFWGAPLDDSKHALHAVTNALAIQKEIAAFDPQIQIGIGINTGVMNVGDMGSKFRRSYTVLGDAVNLASRLEGQTRFYHIDVIVGETTFLQTKEAFIYRMIDKIKVKGKEKATLIYSPVCHKQETSSEIETEIKLHHKALESYFAQEWNTAENAFMKLIEQYPRNKMLYDVYLKRIATFRQNPPGSNWDGAYVSQEK